MFGKVHTKSAKNRIRKIISTSFFILTLSIAHSQIFTTPPPISPKDIIKFKRGSFEFIHSLPVSFFSETKNIINQKPIKKGHKVSILYEIRGTIYFKYWNFDKDKDSENYQSFNEGEKVFSIDKDLFEQLTKPLFRKYKGARIGGYTIPFRLRGIGGGNDFDFESSLSLQANLVFGFGSIYKKESWFDASIGLGLTGVNLNAKNTGEGENDGIIGERTANAFTISLGAVVKPAKFANLGIFMGWDFLGQKDKEVNWIYNGKKWIGLGINISFNEVKTDLPAPDSGNK